MDPTELDQLADGDVVLLSPDGSVRQFWDADSRDNVVFVTSRCNCRCIMCPQPPEEDANSLLPFNLRLLRLAASASTSALALTGGEPLLCPADVCTLLRHSTRYQPNAAVALLTNGRAYRDEGAVARIAEVRHPNLTHCVSLHADAETLNDEIANSKGCFADVVLGLHNLARHWQHVELRVVINRLNASRLPRMAEFIYRNFPFVVHVAFMGLEITGKAAINLGRVWIDPSSFAQQLARAVRHLARRDLQVSIYNVPLCVVPLELHDFCRDSISDWKKTYLPVCSACVARTRCCGVFGTSTSHTSELHPLRQAQRLATAESPPPRCHPQRRPGAER